MGEFHRHISGDQDTADLIALNEDVREAWNGWWVWRRNPLVIPDLELTRLVSVGCAIACPKNANGSIHTTSNGLFKVTFEIDDGSSTVTSALVSVPQTHVRDRQSGSGEKSRETYRQLERPSKAR